MSSQALDDWAMAHRPQLGHLATHEEHDEHGIHLEDHLSHEQQHGHGHELASYPMDLVNFDDAHHQYSNDLDGHRHGMHMPSFGHVNDADLAELDSVFSMRHDHSREFDSLPVSEQLIEASNIFYSPLINDLNDSHGTPLISPAMEPSREQAISGEITMPPTYLNSPMSSKGASPSSQPISAPLHPRTTEHVSSQRKRLQHNSQSPQNISDQQHINTSSNNASYGAVTPAILMNLAPSKSSPQDPYPMEHSMENKLQDALRAAAQINDVDRMASPDSENQSSQQSTATGRVGPTRKSRSNQSTPVISAGNMKSRRRSSATSLKSMSASNTPVLFARQSRGSNRSTPTMAPILPAQSIQQQAPITLPSATQSKMNYNSSSEEHSSEYSCHESDQPVSIAQKPSPQSLSATFMLQTSKSSVGESPQLPYNLSYTQKIAEEANEKKASHKIAEQERRQRLNSAITELSRTVDPTTPMTSKAATIEGATAYIRKLQARVAELEQELKSKQKQK